MWHATGTQGQEPVTVPAQSESLAWEFACGMLKEGYDTVRIEQEGRLIADTGAVRNWCIKNGRYSGTHPSGLSGSFGGPD